MSKTVETIVANATPPGRGGIAIIRVSGSLVSTIAEHILGKIPTPRTAQFFSFLDEASDAIDEGIALFFPAPHSFTGDDVLELQGHGGPAIVNALIQRIVSLGARLARPGEFSERAFLNDKIDLVQAEAIADLIDASSYQAARSALRSLQGEFSKKIQDLVAKLIQLRLYVEASIDFVEEEIDVLSDGQIERRLNDIILSIETIRKSANQGIILREGMTAVIAGAPNVGKSSLLNQLSEKEVAIVTDIAGTTRDVLRTHILIDGMPLHIIDTAGLRDSPDVIEQEGIRRAQAEIELADIVLVVMDARSTESIVETLPAHFPIVLIRNKIDLTNETPTLQQVDGKTVISLSAKTGTGLDLLKNHIKTVAGFQTEEGLFSARERHLDALNRAFQFLMNAQSHCSLPPALELLAEDCRQAQYALNEITGEFTSDDLLGEIFSRFCIGK